MRGSRLHPLTAIVHGTRQVADRLTGSRHAPAHQHVLAWAPSSLPSEREKRVPGANIAGQVACELTECAFRYETCDIPAGMPIDRWRKARERNNAGGVGGS